jgi:transcriptional regulator with XRE-family HTH domain
VDAKSEIREFLTSRRARITPEQAGLRIYGTGPRRVPGLRREEAALLAGVSVDYYTRLERGNLNGVSETVLEALARALQLNDTERRHLFDLARATQTVMPRRRRRTRQQIRPAVQQMLDAIRACRPSSATDASTSSCDSGVKNMHHPLVGEIKISFEAMELVADPGLTMWIYTAEPGSRSEQALNLLGSWTATPEKETVHADHTKRP